MLIYNFQKEFLGIDEKDLKILGFNSLSELRAEVTDFADLFVKTPGYVHNFQHVHWIDFINYADVSEESKVLINVNAKTFKATLSIAPIFLIDNPASPAYIIQLNNLRPLSKSENENISSDVLDRELPKVEPQVAKVFVPAAEIAPVKYDAYDEAPQTQTPEPQVQESIEIPLEEEPLEMLDVGDLSLDVFEEESAPEPVAPAAVTPTPAAKKVIKKEVVQEEWGNGYQYDPHIASKELGLPLDLIEEFIQDFIAQAKEFKQDIYSSIDEGDVDNVKILSHKLKGVAANLRIEDAYEALSAVSATSDMDLIHDNLDTFYKIIAKLSGEEPIALDFKDDDDEAIDIINIEDEDVPEKIEMPELADDDFLEIASDENEEIAEVAEEEEEEEEEEEIHFSKTQAAKEIGIDEASFNELFEDFVGESHIIFQKIETAIADNDLQTCHNEALKFKGMSDNMRFHEFTNKLKTLIHSSDKDEIDEAVKKIDTSLKKISKMGA